jgi:type IV secretory pathway TrbL component
MESAPTAQRSAGIRHVRSRIQRIKAMSHYVQFGIILITLPNLIAIVTMIIVFVIGLLVKLPDHKGS